MKEIRVNDLEKWVESTMERIDVSANDKSERNSVSYSQIIEAYEESKEQY